MNNKKNNNPIFRLIIVMLFFFAIIGSFSLFSGMNEGAKKIDYTELKKDIAADKVKTLEIKPSYGTYAVTGTYKGKDKTLSSHFTSTIPEQEEVYGDIIKLTEEHKVETTFNQQDHTTAMQSLLGNLLVMGLMLWAMFFLMSKVAGGKGGPMKVGENKARRVTDSKVTFKDVIGYEEEKQELVEIIDFLKDPKKYEEMGAKIPNGVLLEGPPGTGKTLIAKAVAGEANVPFYTISGSDFIEMFVGVGASRVRSLFKEAKKDKAAIVFIDEIDAIGSRDSGGPGGRNPEQEQTINALLVELDGFATEKGGVIIIGATNRADKLDKALLRPGRFDRKVMVGLPEIKEREAILNYHGAKRKVASSVDFKELAKITTGMSGAELEAVINEAAILVVRDRRKEITKEDLDEAVDRVQMGPAKVSNKYSDRDKEIVSYHESGHAIVGLELKDAMQVQKITIIPRRNAGGYVAFTPKDEEKFTTKKQLEAQIIGLLAGRAAEEVYLNEVSTGAHNDLERATAIARAMITEYGMSDLGLYQFEGNAYRSNAYAVKQYSEEQAYRIDEEINKILDHAHTRAIEIVTQRSEDMHLLAKTIREEEVLDRSDIDYLLEHGRLPKDEPSVDTQGEVLEA